MLNKKAQGTLEYLLVLTVVVTAVILFAATTLKPKEQEMLTNVTENLERTVEENVFFTRF